MEYVLIRESVSWNDAVIRCPQVDPRYQLATVRSNADYELLASKVVANFPTANDIYQGAWSAP